MNVPIDSVFAYLEEQIESMLFADSALRRRRPGAVGELRDASHRARSALSLLPRHTDVSLELRWLGNELRDLRTIEVQRRRIRDHLATLENSPMLSTAQSRVDAHFVEQDRGARERAITAVSSHRYLDMLYALEAVVDDRVEPTLSHPTSPSGTGAALRSFDAVQHVLTDHRDSVICRTTLDALARGADESRVIFQVLHKREVEVAASLVTDFRRAWTHAEMACERAGRYSIATVLNS